MCGAWQRGGQDTAALSEVTLVFCGDLGLSEVYSSRLSKVLQPSGSYSLTVILPVGKLRLWSSLETLQRIAPQPNRVGVYVYAFFFFLTCSHLLTELSVEPLSGVELGALRKPVPRVGMACEDWTLLEDGRGYPARLCAPQCRFLMLQGPLGTRPEPLETTAQM